MVVVVVVVFVPPSEPLETYIIVSGVSSCLAAMLEAKSWIP